MPRLGLFHWGAGRRSGVQSSSLPRHGRWGILDFAILAVGAVSPYADLRDLVSQASALVLQDSEAVVLFARKPTHTRQPIKPGSRQRARPAGGTAESPVRVPACSIGCGGGAAVTGEPNARLAALRSTTDPATLASPRAPPDIKGCQLTQSAVVHED